ESGWVRRTLQRELAPGLFLFQENRFDLWLLLGRQRSAGLFHALFQLTETAAGEELIVLPLIHDGLLLRIEASNDLRQQLFIHPAHLDRHRAVWVHGSSLAAPTAPTGAAFAPAAGAGFAASLALTAAF